MVRGLVLQGPVSDRDYAHELDETPSLLSKALLMVLLLLHALYHRCEGSHTQVFAYPFHSLESEQIPFSFLFVNPITIFTLCRNQCPTALPRTYMLPYYWLSASSRALTLALLELHCLSVCMCVLPRHHCPSIVVLLMSVSLQEVVVLIDFGFVLIVIDEFVPLHKCVIDVR